ncbi:MAG TPA: tRNA lysidine(34) synthetase TilS [Bryobacteraceae bacterium]|nr:tRNA lysidine(34) synthetase TilS [Bryobacteraceae bacterium]
MFEPVLKTILRYNMFKPGDRVGVAVSGGADSVYLLHALAALAPRWDLSLCVLHLDHRLRGEESRDDARFVAGLACRLGLPAHLAERDVGRLHSAAGGNLEQTARIARRTYYQKILERENLDRIATGHTRSDQAETVLFRFLRGSGTAGLAAIRPVTSNGFVRPLIDMERSAIELWLREHGVPWREDSSNLSADFARNRIRHALLPQLIRDWNPALVENLAHTARWAQDEESYWMTEIGRLAPGPLLDVTQIRALPPAVGRRLIRSAIGQAKGDLLGIGFDHVERILEMAAAPEGRGHLHLPGLDVLRSFGWIRLAAPESRTVERAFCLPVSIPGRFDIPHQDRVLSLDLIAAEAYDGAVPGLDRDRLSDGLELRNWRPGDRYRPLGRARPEKVKFLFQEARIPLWDRRNWPVLSSNNHIVWARRFGPALEYAATPSSRSIVQVREEPREESIREAR